MIFFNKRQRSCSNAASFGVPGKWKAVIIEEKEKMHKKWINMHQT
jgi:hypothetical protein